MVRLICLLSKLGCVLWAYTRTYKLAAIACGIFLFVSPIPTFIVPRFLGADDFAWFTIFYGTGTAVAEAGLFVWLVRSLLKRPPNRFSPTTSEFDQLTSENPENPMALTHAGLS